MEGTWSFQQCFLALGELHALAITVGQHSLRAKLREDSRRNYEVIT